MKRYLHTLKRSLMRMRRRLYALRCVVPAGRRKHFLESMVGPLGFWDTLRAYQLRVLRSHGLKPGHTMMDLGCGPLQGGVAFIGYLAPRNYVGLDINPRRIEVAREEVARYRLAGKRPMLLTSSTFGQAELNGQVFDFIWASQILYYFDDDAISNLMRMVSQRLAPGGKMLGDIIGPNHYEQKFPEYDVILHTRESLQKAASPYGLHVSVRGELADYGYPRRLSLHSNQLMQVARQQDS